MNARWIRAAVCWLGVAGLAGLAGDAAGFRVTAQQAAAPRFLPVTPMAPLFFREPWQQSRPIDASTAFRPEAGITPAAVTNADLELRLYDPGAKNVPAYLKNPPPGSIPVDWDGPSCIQLGGYNQIRRRRRSSPGSRATRRTCGPACARRRWRPRCATSARWST